MDPFYPRNDLLTAEVVGGVIQNIESIFKHELERFPGYHRTAQGISASEYLIPPGFDQMPFSQQVAVVQGIDRIFQEYRDTGDMVRDPLCHLEMEASRAVKTEFEGKSYYFCSGTCKDKFDSNPGAVLSGKLEPDPPLL